MPNSVNMLHATEPHVGKRAAFMVCAVYHHVKNWGSKAATQWAPGLRGVRGSVALGPCGLTPARRAIS